MIFSTSGCFSFRQSTRTGFRLTAFALTLSLSSNGLAEDSTAPAPAPPGQLTDTSEDLPGETRVVILIAAAEPEDETAAKRSISAQLADLNVDVFFFHMNEPSAATEDQVAAVALEMRKQGAKTAFVIESAESQVLLRILQETQSGVEVTERLVNAAEGAPQDEALAVIVRSAVAAIIHRTTIRSQTPAKKPEVTPAKKDPNPSAPRQTVTPPPGRTHLLGEIGGSLGWFSKNVQPFAGMTVGLTGLPHPNLYLRVGYTAFTSIESRAYSLLLILKRHPVFIGMGYFRKFNHLFISAGVSLVLDYVTENISSTNPAYTLEKEGGELVTALDCHALTGVRIRRPVSLFIRVSAEIPLQNVKYGIHTLKGDTLLIDPLPVQPVLALGLTVDFF